MGPLVHSSMERQETLEECAAIEAHLLESELEKAVAVSIRDRRVCRDDALLDLWVTFPATGRT